MIWFEVNPFVCYIVTIPITFVSTEQLDIRSLFLPWARPTTNCLEHSKGSRIKVVRSVVIGKDEDFWAELRYT